MSLPWRVSDLAGRTDLACRHDALSRYFVFRSLPRGNRYDIYFEHFADEITLDRDHRAEEIQPWMQRYAERLEHYARLAPYNWFNFYSFWDQVAA